MKQIALEALTASQRAVKRGDMGGVEGAGGFTQEWLDSLQSTAIFVLVCFSCSCLTRNIQSTGVQKTEWHQQSASQTQSWPEA